jgi:PGF-CTERM protein
MNQSRTLQTVLCTALLVLAAVSPVAIAGAQSNQSSDAAVEFASPTVETAAGNDATMTIEFENTNRSTLVVGSEDVNFRVATTVVDADGDGEATVTLNTTLAGRTYPKTYLTASDGDELVNATQTTPWLDERLDPAGYTLKLYAGDQQTDSSHVGELVVEESENPRVAVETPSNSPDEAPPEPVFEDQIATTRVGQAVTTTVELGNHGTAVFVVESADGESQATATLVDADGDGTVAVEITPGHDPSNVAFVLNAEGQDRVENRNGSIGYLESGDHDLSLYQNRSSVESDDPTDIGTLAVMERPSNATTTTTTTTTTEATESTSTASATSTTETDAEMPGFGILVALASLGVVGLLGRRDA